MRFREISKEVFVAAEPIVQIGAADISWLKERLQATPRGRVRICAHRDGSDRLHEMIIALAQTTYVRPHKHHDKSESFHVIEGLVDVVALDDQGNISKVLPLGAPGSGRNFFYRIAEPIFHTLLIRTPVLVIHETTNGPFTQGDAIFAPWAPAETEAGAAREYLAGLARAVEAFVQGHPVHENA